MGKKSRMKKERKKKQGVVKNTAIKRQVSEKSPNLSKFNLGDPVVVRGGTPDPDYGHDISGWQGRICRIDDSNNLLMKACNCLA